MVLHHPSSSFHLAEPSFVDPLCYPQYFGVLRRKTVGSWGYSILRWLAIWFFMLGDFCHYVWIVGSVILLWINMHWWPKITGCQLIFQMIHDSISYVQEDSWKSSLYVLFPSSSPFFFLSLAPPAFSATWHQYSFHCWWWSSYNISTSYIIPISSINDEAHLQHGHIIPQVTEAMSVSFLLILWTNFLDS